MLHELQAWWQATSPETQAIIREGGLVLAVLLAGYLLGNMVARSLRAMNFDALVRLTGSAEASNSFSLSRLAGFLVRLTVWAGALYWLARQHDKPEWAAMIGLVISRTWALVTILVVALGLASMVANRFKELMQDTGAPDSRHRSAPSGLAAAIGTAAYGLVLLLTLVAAADYFDWPLTRNSAQALWQLGQHLLTAGAALLIGCVGARFARDLVTPEAAVSPEKHAAQYTGLALVAGTTVLAVTVLLTGAGLSLGLATLAFLGILLWFGRGYLPDLLAALHLGGAREEAADAGFAQTEAPRTTEFGTASNREALLRPRMPGPTAQARR
jgi:hypothetical protein